MSSQAGNLFTSSQATQPSAQQASSLRPQEVAEPIVASRLSKSLSMDNLDHGKRSHALLTLQAVRDLRPAQQFCEEEFGIDAPEELKGEKIGYLDVKYKPSKMPEQRRFALGGRSIFGLPSPQRSAASYGLYVDGDLMASEPVSYMYVCHDHGIDIPLLDRHLASEASREADLATIGAMAPGIKKPRSFAKAYVSMITHDGHWKPKARLIDPSDVSKGTRKNAAAKLYDEYGVDWSVLPPQFLMDLSDELTEASEKIVRLGVHRPIIQALRAIDPAKADRTASALHFVLAVYEYRFLDRCLEMARRMGIVSVCDCLDGFLFLKHTFPPSLSIADAFDKMTRFACDRTGMKGQIREKSIVLPSLPSLISRAFVDLEALRNGGETFEDLGESGLPQIMERMDRHFVFIYARSSQPVVIEKFFYERSHIIERVMERKVLEFTQAFASCELTIGKKQEQVAKLWLKRNDKPQRFFLGFEPNAEQRDRDYETFSLFNGLRHDASPPMDNATALAHHGTQLFLEHFRSILASDNDELFQYLINWHAFALQKRRKPGTIVVFIGETGCGKSILYSAMSRALAGVSRSRSLFAQIYESAYHCTSGLAQVTARFNMNQGGKLFVVCEEIADKKGTANSDELKKLAEGDTMDLEGKYFDTVIVPDHRSIVLLTNHRTALTDTNRKFLQIEVSNKYSTPSRARDPDIDREAEAHFIAIGNAMADPDSVRAFFWYLTTLDISEWSAEPVPVTPLMKQLALESEPFGPWFTDFASGRLDDHQVYIQGNHYGTSDLYSLMQTWALEKGLIIEMTDSQFSYRLARFASTNERSLRRSNHAFNGWGYIMNQPSTSAEPPTQDM